MQVTLDEKLSFSLESAGQFLELNEAIERLKSGINCATRTGNHHALSEMQSMLDELDR